MAFIYFVCFLTNLEGTIVKEKKTLQAAASDIVSHYVDLMISGDHKMQEGVLSVST